MMIFELQSHKSHLKKSYESRIFLFVYLFILEKE